MRIAIDIDSTLHHYWDQLEEIAQRRFGVEIPYAEQTCGRSTTQARAAVGGRQGDPPRAAHPGRRALPGRGRDGPALARGRPLHPHHLPPRAARPTRPRSAGSSRSACPTTSCTAPTTRSPAARRSGSTCWSTTRPYNLARRDRGRHRRRDARCTPGTASCARPRTSSAREDWPELAAASNPLEPVLAHEAAARAASEDLRDYLPGDRARAPGLRLGPLRARRGPDGQDALRLPLPLLVPLRGRGDRERPRRPAAPCSSPTTPARCRPTRR